MKFSKGDIVKVRNYNDERWIYGTYEYYSLSQYAFDYKHFVNIKGKVMPFRICEYKEG